MDSLIVTVRPHHTKREEIQRLGLPLEITVRFVRVILDDGEVEVLVTSLLDETRYPTSLFKPLYHLRWGVETFYDRVKNRLNLENFSGFPVEAVKQDFYATCFISRLESILTQDAGAILDQKTDQNRYPQQVNKAVSFNAIQNQVIQLLITEQNLELLCTQLTDLFLTTPVCVRPGRKVERKKRKPGRLLHYYKRLRKICF